MNSPPEIANNYIGIGAKKAKTHPLKQFVLAMYAGFFIAGGGVVSTVVKVGGINDTYGGWNSLVGGLVFPIGLTLVLVAGAELFTGNCLLVIPLIAGKITALEMLISWVIVWFGNFVGSLVMAFLVVYGGVFKDFAQHNAAYKTAEAKTNLSFGDAFAKGIACNAMVCLAVWMSFGARDIGGKILALWGPITLFVTCGFEHSVANMYFIPAGLLCTYKYDKDLKRHNCDWQRMFHKNLIPVTLGNIVGGSVFIGLGYYFVYICNFGNTSKPPKPTPALEQREIEKIESDSKIVPTESNIVFMNDK